MLFTVHCSLKRLAILMGGLLALVFVCGATGGCGGESFVDSTSYQYPNWTPEGLIYCQKAVTHYRKYWGAIGGEYSENRGTDYYYVTMSTEGTNETTLPYTSYPYFSPLGTYVALISGETISIVRRADNTQVHSFSPTTESISELDWGTNDDKIVFRTNKDVVYISNINGSSMERIHQKGYSMAWGYGSKIIVDGSPEVVAIDSSSYSEAVEYLKVEGGEFNISPAATNEVVYRSAYEEGIKKFHLTSPEADPIILIARNDLWGIHVSLDGQKIVAHGDNIYGQEIWIININGSNLTQLK